MRLRIFAPATDRPDPGAAWPWVLLDARGAALREDRSPLAQAPRAEDVELVLPAARVLFARLRLPRVGGATLRELLPYAVEDRLLADPANIHAVAGRSDERGETQVAVVDREWLQAVLDAARGAGLRPAKAFCETALAPAEDGAWHLVAGSARGLLVDERGGGVAFDRGTSALPLALRIALDEAAARGDRPRVIRVHAEAGAAMPDLARWSAEASVPMEAGPPWEDRARGPARPDALDLLGREFSQRSSRFAALRVPRAALFLAAAVVVLQVGLDGVQAWRLSRERARLGAKAEAVFREAFPEARAVVDPMLQMQRNLAQLRRSRGLAGNDDFLAQLTRAAREADGPVHAVEYADGKLVVRRTGSPVSEAAR